MASSDSKVILKTPDDWDSFEKHLHREAESLELLDYLFEKKELISEPIMPIMENYKKPRQASADTQQTIAGDSTSQLSTEEVTTFGSLSDKAQRAYQFDYSIYQDQRKEYKHERQAVKKLRDWILSATEKYYSDTACEPNEDPRTWYKNLKQSAGLEETLVLDNVHRAYQTATKPLKKQPKDFEIWITTWERAMDKAKKKELPEVARPETWFRDFLNALAVIKPSWVESFRMLHRRNVLTGTLTYRDVANELRTSVREEMKPERVKAGPFAHGSFLTDVVSQTQQSQMNKEHTAIVDASFGVATAAGQKGPTFAGKGGDHHTQADAQGDERHSTKAKGRSSSKRRNTDAESTVSNVCRGCGQRGHVYTECYYLIPERAPARFIPRREVQAYVKVVLEDNTVLAEEIARIRLQERKAEKKKKDSKDMKKSVKFQTPQDTSSESSN